MSLLNRYRKQGGFEQLVLLIENCPGKRQKLLLEAVRKEEPQWAEEIKSKLLSFDRIISFSPQFLKRVLAEIPEKILVFAMFGQKGEIRQKMLLGFPQMKRDAFMELLEGIRPSSDEIEAAKLFIVSKTRNLDKEKVISLKEIDPQLTFRAS